MMPIRAAAIGGGRLLRLSSLNRFMQGAGTGTLDIPVTTATGKILLVAVCGDVSGTVESPYTITYDLGGSGNVFTQHRAVGGGEGSGRPRLIMASVTGVPVTGQSKNIRLATAASSLTNFNILTADLPSWWSGTIGNHDASAVNSTKASHTSPSIVTGARNSLLVACGGCIDLTVGALDLSGQGGAWRLAISPTQTGSGATGYRGMFGTKIVPVSGTTVDATVSTVGGGNSTNWSAGVIEIRP